MGSPIRRSHHKSSFHRRNSHRRSEYHLSKTRTTHREDRGGRSWRHIRTARPLLSRPKCMTNLPGTRNHRSSSKPYRPCVSQIPERQSSAPAQGFPKHPSPSVHSRRTSSRSARLALVWGDIWCETSVKLSTIAVSVTDSLRRSLMHILPEPRDRRCHSIAALSDKDLVTVPRHFGTVTTDQPPDYLKDNRKWRGLKRRGRFVARQQSPLQALFGAMFRHVALQAVA